MFFYIFLAELYSIYAEEHLIVLGELEYSNGNVSYFLIFLWIIHSVLNSEFSTQNLIFKKPKMLTKQIHTLVHYQFFLQKATGLTRSEPWSISVTFLENFLPSCIFIFFISHQRLSRTCRKNRAGVPVLGSGKIKKLKNIMKNIVSADKDLLFRVRVRGIWIFFCFVFFYIFIEICLIFLIKKSFSSLL